MVSPQSTQSVRPALTSVWWRSAAIASSVHRSAWYCARSSSSAKRSTASSPWPDCLRLAMVADRCDNSMIKRAEAGAPCCWTTKGTDRLQRQRLTASPRPSPPARGSGPGCPLRSVRKAPDRSRPGPRAVDNGRPLWECRCAAPAVAGSPAGVPVPISPPSACPVLLHCRLF